MPRILTDEQRDLLHYDKVGVRTLATFFMDDGVYRYCDDTVEVTDGVNTWIGASAIASAADVRSGTGLSAEPLELTIDGTRVFQATLGSIDPNDLFREILNLKLHNRRFNLDYGLFKADEPAGPMPLVLPAFAGLINHARVTMPQTSLDDFIKGEARPQPKLTIVIDSITARYGWTTGRTRSDEDQQELYEGDRFFKFVNDIAMNESRLYWGRKTPYSVGGGVATQALRNIFS